MYYSDITDNEVKAFHEKIKLTAGYTELKALDSDLFDETTQNKCVPLFYSDEITGNENIRILDNKLILYTDDDDLDSVQFTSANEGVEFQVTTTTTITVDNDRFLMMHFYDNKSTFNLPYFKFHLKQADGTIKGIEGDYITDGYGDIIIDVNNNGNYHYTITSKETGQEVVT